MSNRNDQPVKHKNKSRDSFLKNDPITVFGLLVSLIISVVLVIFDVATPMEGFISGLILTMLSLLVQMMYDARNRAELDQALRQAGWLRGRVTLLTQKTSDLVDKYSDTEIALEAEQRFNSLEREIDGLFRGTIERPGDDYTDLLSATSRSSQEILAITNLVQHDGSDPATWWVGNVGKRYWEANLDAISRRVKITRIFIYSSIDERVMGLLRQQSDAGVNVRVLDATLVDPSKHINVTVWDSSKAWEAKMNARGAIVKNLFHVNEHDVRRLTMDFRTCDTYSVPFSEIDI